MAQIVNCLIIVLCIFALIYITLATFTDWLPCITSNIFKCKCTATYKYGTSMLTPWKQVVEVSGTWIPDEEYTVVRKRYLFGTVKYQVVTPFEDV